jgi:hypothetical protein
MSVYYYPQQQPLLKQSSQILTSLPLQQQTAHILVRSTLTDRSQHDPKSSYLLSPLYPLQPLIVR